MAKYQAEIKTVTDGSQYTVSVESGSISTAKQEIERLYNPIYIYNLRVARGSSSSSSDTDYGGIFYLLLLFGAIYVIMNYWPFLLGAGALYLIYKLCVNFL